MKRDIAEKILNAAQTYVSGSTVSGPAAKIVVSAWLQATGLEPNQWGKYVQANGKRWAISERTVHLQSRTGGGDWHNERTYGLIDIAINLIDLAEKEIGGDLGKRLQSKRGSAQDKAQAKRQSEKFAATANALAAKYMAFHHWDEALRSARRQSIPEEKRRELAEVQKRAHEDYLGLVRSGAQLPDDSQFASAEKPPFIPMFFKNIDYRFDVEQDGVIYSVRVEHGDSGRAKLHIGRAAGGFAQVDPLSHQMRGYFGPELHGDGTLDGAITNTDDDQFVGQVFLISADERKKGAGGRMLRLFCRLMKGYGVKHWLGEAIGEEGQAFLEAMERKGQIKIVQRDGSYWAIACK